ncbi:MAG: DUF2760 domain-containing protein [Gammaproteobacteria bacterium]|nr:DUF2760 domain-containing protein [Gammaproteobacteria bacterium]
MDHKTPSFPTRIALALSALFRVLFDPQFASAVERIRRGGVPISAETVQAGAEKPAPPPPLLKEAGPDAALQLLGLLQQEGRFIDFIEEDVAGYADAEIGAAARLVHDGCRRVLREHLTIEPVREETEGSRVTLERGFDATSVRVTGNVVGEPPFHGVVTHRGWRAGGVRLPKLAVGHDVTVLASAEVEL